MKSFPSTPACRAWLLAASLLGGALGSVQATNYAGNGNTSFGGDIGNGSLSLTDDGTNIYGTLVVGNGNSMWNDLVIYIDTGAGGGFADTSGFNDQNDALRVSISGVSGSGRSLLTFTNNFQPQYAIALGPNTASFGGLWQLADGGGNSLNYITSANLSPVGTQNGPFTFSIPAAAIGLTNNSQATIKIFGTYISTSGYRSEEAVAGNLTTAFSSGWNPFTQTAFATYTFAQAVIPTIPLSFQVDMTEQIASGQFNPANGDTVSAAGTFQTNAWTAGSFLLSPSGSNPNIYVGTYADQDPAGTVENFKYIITSGGNSTWESFSGNRTVTLGSSATTVPLSYFNYAPASPSATTNTLNFSINMAPEIYLGNFHPGNGDQIEVFGSFQSSPWSAGFILTNSPANTNLYSGSFVDGNYPGAQYQYKYVIVSGGNNNYENGNNRTLTTVAGQNNLPVAYFNGISNIYSTPVTFQVDMSLPIAAGTFNPGNGDTVSVSGSFQTNQWTPNAFLLSPTGGNGHIYSGTYTVADQPGTGEQYKFVITTSGGPTNYETISANRTFLLGSSATTLPVVYYNNLDPNNALLAPTVVTFSLTITNGTLDVFGNPFNPATDLIFVDGDFTSPQWQVMGNATDPTIDQDYPAYVMTNNPIGSSTYTAQFTIPAGNPLQLTYKYGIYHNQPYQINTNVDNEAGFALNHSRYIRATNTYNLPSDTFGAQRVSLANATEISFGNLTIGAPSAGKALVSWLGRPGVYLQSATNLASPTWSTIPYTNGVSSNNWSTTGNPTYFRLYNP